MTEQFNHAAEDTSGQEARTGATITATADHLGSTASSLDPYREIPTVLRPVARAIHGAQKDGRPRFPLAGHILSPEVRDAAATNNEKKQSEADAKRDATKSYLGKSARKVLSSTMLGRFIK